MFPKHPTRVQLILYVESILDRKGPIYSGIARHISKCQQCREEVEAIKNSLKFFNPEVVAEPPEELTNEIIKRAREINKKKKFERSASKYRRPYITVICCAIIWGVIGYYTFGQLYLKSDLFRADLTIQYIDTPYMSNTNLAIQKDSDKGEDSLLWNQIEVLGSILKPVMKNGDIKTYSYVRMVSVLDDEIEKVQKVLEKYPEDERVRRLIRNNMQEKVEILKRIYKEGLL